MLGQRNKHRFMAVLCAVAACAFCALNVIAYNQAYAMLHFAKAGTRTLPPEALSLLAKLKVLFLGVVIPKPHNDATPDTLQLPYHLHQIPIDDGTTLAAWHISYAQSHGLVILFHGYAIAKSSTLPHAAAFHELGYATVLVDFRGSGGSDGYQTTVGHCEAVDVARAVAFAAELTDGPIILFGQSMGGAAILRALQLGIVDADAIIIESVFDEMLAAVQNRFSTMGIPSFPAANLLIFWAGQQIGFSGFAHNPVDYAAAVRTPILVTHGGHDARVTTAQGSDSIKQSHRGRRPWWCLRVRDTPMD